MKISKSLEKDIIRLWKLNKEASKLDIKIRDLLEAKGLIDSFGDGQNGFSADVFIDICEYGNGDPEEVIDMLRNI